MALITAACSTAVREAEPFVGVWVSEGWGIVLHVHGGDADIYEVSSAHCVLASAGSARNIDDVVALDGERLVLTDAGRVVRFDRVTELPAACTFEPDPSPAGVLDVVVASIEEHYHPGVDPGWTERIATVVPPPEGDDAALAAAVETLLTPLADAQIALQTGSDGLWSPVSGGVAEDLAAALTGGTLLPGATIAGDGGLVTADLGDGVRYLGFLRIGGFAGSSDDSQRVLAAVLDHSLEEATALVIDLRSTTAGSETEALLVATRFMPTRTVVATTEARLSDGSTVPAGEAVVNPMPGGPFPGSVVVLVGPGTSGPAELLVLALAPLPGVTIVGEPTAGSPRSPLVRTLPNGWLLGVPNTEVITPDGMRHAGAPVVPDVTVALGADDLAAGRDPGLEAARSLLAG